MGEATVIFIQSTAHWEAIQKQRVQVEGASAASSQPPAIPEPFSLDATTKSKKKKRFVPQRESLARRNRLLVGKEGSRRRQRWDNNNFSDHPFAVLHPDDLRPPGYSHQRPSFHWTDEDAAVILEAEYEFWDENHPDLNGACTAPLTRSVRQDLKKMHIPKGLVIFYENQLLDFMQQMQMVSLDTSTPYMQWEIGDAFARWIVHALCRYYGLVSLSKTLNDGRRVTFACHKAHLDCVLGNQHTPIDAAETLEWDMPAMSFYDYLFNRTL
ncbi:uncharacterized protein BYT42DRAFT_612086 [Radiomyces spectabilis]|uniref:uncharacterized protein n=1 Tax=Radiomyces spectabilis TaxID=64574 RepID=UPI00221F1CD9|nr:uncharacterized protein BYT42DRAFT_612086 [Radiomyces spectabilis]KAI8384382.1 hypothetical protein BYT42DRAFT_612086 [Radiomyces spectabilis]